MIDVFRLFVFSGMVFAGILGNVAALVLLNEAVPLDWPMAYAAIGIAIGWVLRSNLSRT